MLHKVIRFSLPLLFLACVSVEGQENGTSGAQAPAALKPFQWNAELDSYAEGNFNIPGSSLNALRSFDTHSNAFRLAGTSVDLDYNSGYFAGHLTGGYGDLFRAMAETDRLKSANSYLSQYFVSYKPLKDTGLQFDVGKFYTSVGAEVPDTQLNFNYSRSLLFALGEPFYHFGFRAVIPITKTFTVGAQLVNGWNNVEDNNSGKTVGVTTAFTRTKWSWSQAFLIGPEKDGITAGKRQVANEIATFTPRQALQAYAELLYGRDQRAGLNTGADSWYGIALATRWSATKKLSFSPRFEYYIDQTGFTSGTPQHLREVTATAEYRVHSLVTTRLEYRKDFSNQRFFEHSQSGYVMQQGTVALAILMSLKREH